VARLGSAIRKVIIFRNRSFGLLWASQLLSGGGDWMLQVAVPVYVFRLTGSAGDTGLTVVAGIMPRLVLGPLAGVFADRWSRQRTMIGSDLLCAAVVSLLLLAHRPGQLWLILLATLAENCACSFFGPAYQAVVPALVGRGRDLATANAWSAAAGGAVRLTCAPLGGVLYALAGFRLPVAADAGTYLVSALLVSLIAARTGPEGPAGHDSPAPPRRTRLRGLVTELKDGAAALRRDRVLTVLLTVSALFLLGNGACTALLVPYVTGSLHVRAASIGELFSALGAGYLLSAYFGRRVCAGARLRGPVLALLGLLVAAFTGLFNVREFAPALIFIGLLGLGGGTFLMLEQTVVQRRTPDSVLGRISSAYSAVVMAATLAGALLASLVVTWAGRTVALNLAIAVIASGAAVATRLPTRIAAGPTASQPAKERPEAGVSRVTAGS
jgi:MFS family permease